MLTYESKLDSDPALALREGGMHFEGESAVHHALRRITARLDELGIPYALAGGMALFLHGYRRFTEDIDLIVTSDGLKAAQDALVGRGYRPAFQGSKNLRDTEHGVRIEFLISGEYPGDGKPKPVSFPDPTAAEEITGVKCLNLAKVIELKLASGTAPGRRKDLGDVQELIRILKIKKGFSNQLDPSVRSLFLELWSELQGAPGLLYDDE